MNMERLNTENVDKTVLVTPRPTAASTAAVDRRNPYKRPQNEDYDNSFGIIPLNNVSMGETLSDMNIRDLKQIKEQASNTLQRAASKLSALPSRYLKPSTSNSDSMSDSNIHLSVGSTISESDLLQTPRNASTPRVSLDTDEFNISNQPRPSIGESLSRLSEKLNRSDITVDDAYNEFQRMIKNNEVTQHSVSDIFIPAEEAGPKLLQDELSWRRKHDDIPPANSSKYSAARFSSLDPANRISMGEFFRQKSDTISDFKALSPEKTNKPIPLIEPSSMLDSTEFDESTLGENAMESLHISDIAKLLAENTPRKFVDILSNMPKNRNKDSTREKKSSMSIPCSKNSSYTSNFSENGAIRDIVNKENIDDTNLKQSNTEIDYKFGNKNENSNFSDQNTDSKLSDIRSGATSQRSSSSLSNLANGRLPIETTKTELNWDCVKVDKSSSQQFVLRNKTDRRLRIQYTVTGHSFVIRKDGQLDFDQLGGNKICLLPYESKKFHVSFIPTSIGASFDEIQFSSADPHLQQTKKQVVRLYGYGGFGNIRYCKVTKDVGGRYWFSLGRLDSRPTLTETFNIVNNGTLPIFIYVSYRSHKMFQFTSVSVSVESFVLLPQEQKEITVSYTPTAEDHKFVQMVSNLSVSEMGNLKIIWGTEVNRARFKRIWRRAEGKGIELTSLGKLLLERINGEVTPSDISSFKESVSAIKDILQMINCDEIQLTLEYDPDQTLVPQFSDESALFHTLYQTYSEEQDSVLNTNNYKLEPSNIVLMPPMKTEDVLFLISDSKRTLSYTASSVPRGLIIEPTMGKISQGETQVLKIKCPEDINERTIYKVTLNIDDDVLEADVKVMFILSSSKNK